MYYVNVEQIGERLAIIPVLSQAAQRLCTEWNEASPDVLHGLAQERVLHLAIEIVTDVGSLMIDGFLMRDASSYEDIIEILRMEQVFEQERVEPLLALVRLRKPLVQEYMHQLREERHPLLAQLPAILESFASAVQAYIAKEQL